MKRARTPAQETDRTARQRRILADFPSANILVVGDVMLDTYLSGTIDRISPEAPIPVVRFREKRHVPGGAANVAHNIVALGGQATLIGVRGNDASGTLLDALLKRAGIAAMLLKDPSRPTTEKQRIVAAGGQQVVRLDIEQTDALPDTIRRKLLEQVRKQLPRHDVLLLSDYAKGVLTADTLQALVGMANDLKKPVVLGPKPKSRSYLDMLRGLSLLIPNRKEAEMLADKPYRNAQKLGDYLASAIDAPVLVTLGADGMLLSRPDESPVKLETHAHSVVDVSGAGDTVIATLCMALSAGAELADAADLANRAAGVVVTKAGTATLSAQELTDMLSSQA